jgi:hypothetical protein
MEKEVIASLSQAPDTAATKEYGIMSPLAENPRHGASNNQSDRTQATHLRNFTPKILNENNRKLN